jgi:hypothetical protein
VDGFRTGVENFRMVPIAIIPMSRPRRLSFITLTLVVSVAALSTSAPVPDSTNPGLAPELVAQIAAPLIAEAIPREYERSEDWGRTRKITTGVRSSGNFFKFDIHSRKKEVNDGVWKKYRVTLVEPEKHLAVRIDNLRKLDSGRYSFTLFVTAKLHGWARAIVYERGVHIISLEGEGDTSVRLWLDAEIGIESVPGKTIVPGIALRPAVTSARLKLDDFRLTRISDVRGPLVRELGDGLRHVIEDKLSGPELAAKINRSIDKRRDRLEITPDKLLGKL